MKPSMVSAAEVEALYRTSEAFKSLPIEFETRTGLTIPEITARARKAVDDFKSRGVELGLVIVDHMLKVRPTDRYKGNSVRELDEVSDGMTAMAKSLNVAAVGLHQLNRQVESRDNQRPTLSDLRGSGSLEQDADVVLFVYRPAYPLERQLQESPDKRAEAEILLNGVKNDLEIQIAKQRNGPTKTLEFFVDMQANVVRDKVRETAAQPQKGGVVYSLHNRGA
jgi:replicative DNA helicase